jgi:hypothetical protein
MAATDPDLDPAQCVKEVSSLELDADTRSAVGTALSCAPEHVALLNNVRWTIFERLREQNDDNHDASERGILKELHELFDHNEHARPLSDLRPLENEALEILTESQDTPQSADGEQDAAIGVETVTLHARSAEKLRQRFLDWFKTVDRDHDLSKLSFKITPLKGDD